MHKSIYLSFLILLVFVFGCDHDKRQLRHNEFQAWIQENGKIKVLSTTGMINDLVKQIGGEHVDSISLIYGELDPHSYQLVKGDDEKLAFARIIFYNGVGLEHGASLNAYLQNNPKAISLGDQLNLKYPGLILLVNGQKDPHIWMDISLWSKTVPFIVDALSRLDPDHSEVFKKNGSRLESELMNTHQEVMSTMHKLPPKDRYLVTSHDAFNYFARAYLSSDGELETGNWTQRFAAPEGLAPESQLSVTDIEAIIQHLKRYQIHSIFPETNVSRDSLKKIVQVAEESGLNVYIACCPLYADALGPVGSEGDTYLKMMLYNARTLAHHMKVDHDLINSIHDKSNE